MHAKINIQMDNAAFADEPAVELARILRNLAQSVEDGRTECPAHDYNGNTVGRFEIHKDGDPVLTALRAMTPIFVLLIEGTKNILHPHAMELAREAIKQAEL